MKSGELPSGGESTPRAAFTISVLAEVGAVEKGAAQGSGKTKAAIRGGKNYNYF